MLRAGGRDLILGNKGESRGTNTEHQKKTRLT